MAIEHIEKDVPVTRMLGFTIERNLTIANIIQIALLLFAILAGGFSAWDKLNSLEGQIQTTQAELETQVSSVRMEFQNYTADQKTDTRERMTNRDRQLDALSNRVSAVELDAAVYRNKVDTLTDSINKLSSAIERLAESGER